jgi:hypothetical protein
MALEAREDGMTRWMDTALAMITTTGLVTALMGWMVVLGG